MTNPSGISIHLIFLLIIVSGCVERDNRKELKPNILLCIADDASYPHMGEACKWVSTPSFDRIAREGLYFSSVYTPTSKCAPSRACLLTGRNPWQLKAAANHFSYFPPEFTTFMEVLGKNGYFVGHTAKGWGPGIALTVQGEDRELTGRSWDEIRTIPPSKQMADVDYAANFEEFFKNKPADEPFCFWYGGFEPHRRYAYASSTRAGKGISEIDRVPAFFPDNEIVRTDMLDYGLEIEYFDLHVGRMLAFLEEHGELSNTLVIVTSDNGMPFPRAKSDAYDYSVHMPMAAMWPRGISEPGRVIEDFVSFIDLAPTFLDYAGVKWEESGMQTTPGKSLRPIFSKAETPGAFRDFVLVGKERHDVGRPDDYGYPIRGIVMKNWLYLINYREDLWPAGNPQTGYTTVAGSPTKTQVLESRHDPEARYLWELSFGKREREELYDLTRDMDCIHNLAEIPDYSGICKELKQTMEAGLKEESDPRMSGNGDIFHRYEFSDSRWRNLYERMVVNREDIYPGWINKSDIEPDFQEKEDH